MRGRVETRSRHQLLLLGGVSVAVAALLWGFGWVPGDVYGSPPSWLLFLLAFMWVESSQLHIEVRRQTFSVSLSEFSLVLGIFLIGPLPTLLTRLLGNAALMALRKAAPAKLLFNSCIFALECSIAPALIFSIGSADVTQQSTWVAVFVAIFVADLVSGGLVALAIASAQGWPSTQQLTRMNIAVIGVGAFNATVALIVLILVQVNVKATVLMVFLGAVLIVAFRAYAKSVQQHRTLGQVYDFAKTVEESTIAVRGGHQALEAVREMLNARSAAIWLVATDDAPMRVLFADSETSESGYEGPEDPEDALRRRVMRDDAGVLFDRRTAGPDELAALSVRGAEQVIGVPLSSASGAVGYLEVCDRLGDRLAFSSEDIELMGSLATHVSAASQNSQLLAKLSYDASHDPLTGLPNRRRLTEIIAALLEEVPPDHVEIAVLVVDLSALTQINDTLGHEAGDELLLSVAARLTEAAPDSATVGRMGGDEFALVLPVDNLDDAEDRAEGIRQAVSIRYDVAGVTVEVSAVLGVAVGPSDAGSASTLLQHADVALYAGHAAGRAVTSYQPAMGQSSLRRLHLGTQLREAMLSGQVFVVFQPLVDLSSHNISGVETLVRWQHPRYGAVSPDDFIPLAERIGLITPLTMHVLQLALQQCRSWLDRDLRIPVSVNLSARTLIDHSFPAAVTSLLHELDVPADLLTFEITESSVMSDPETALPVLHSLHNHGIRLAVDDFGTGYSSLAYLRRLPVDEVKIDKGFIQNLGTDIGDAAITRAIIELAHNLSLTVVAEGVEDELTRDLLVTMNCDTIQGYLVSRPLPGPRLDRWLAVRTAAEPSELSSPGRQVFIVPGG